MKYWKKTLSLILVVLLLLAVPVSVSADTVDVEGTNYSIQENEDTDYEQQEIEAEADLVEGEFSASVTSAEGCEIHEWKSEDDGCYYLFLTSKMDIPSLSIKLTGGIVNASKGSVDCVTGELTDAFSQAGDMVTLKDAKGSSYNLVVMQSTLPSLYIDLNDTSLETIHADKNIKYAGNSVVISDPNGVYDLNSSNVEMKGRGNSSWDDFSKKSYQIKFEKKTSVLGMDKAKKWLLISNAGDETLMHNMLAFQLAKSIDMPYTTDFQYVDLWVEGEYLGNYIIGEKIEIGSGRVELYDQYGTIFEKDEAYYRRERYYFYNEQLFSHFVVKETNADEENELEVQLVIGQFQQKLDSLTNFLDSSNLSSISLDELSAYMDVDSFAKYYLMNEYAANWDSTQSSCFWYIDGENDVLHVGPVWDYDESYGNSSTGYEYYFSKQPLYQRLLSCSAFYDRTVELYQQYKEYFDQLSDNAERIYSYIALSVDMNYVRWDVWGQENPKVSSTILPYSANYQEGLQNMQNWLSNRASTFVPQSVPYINAEIEDDRFLDITISGCEDADSMYFPVWGSVDGQNDLRWYDGKKQADGRWKCRVLLYNHGELGAYSVHAYKNGKSSDNLVAYRSIVVNSIDPTVTKCGPQYDSKKGRYILYDEDFYEYIGSGTPVVDGKKYFVQEGVLKTGWLKLSSWQMYFDPDTFAAATGVVEIKTAAGEVKAYMFDKNGVEVLKSRTEVIDGKKYWFQPDGSLLKGWCRLGDWTMYFYPDTYAAAVGCVKIDGKYYEFNSDGIMTNVYVGLVGPQYEGGKWVLYNEDGNKVTKNGTPVVAGKKYYVDNGVLKSGWLKLSNWQMYFYPDTFAAAIGIVEVPNKEGVVNAYMFDKNGVEVLKSRTEVIDGKKYWFQPDGSLKTGWCTLGQWRMYFFPDTYYAATGTVTIDGEQYTFNQDGVLISQESS